MPRIRPYLLAGGKSSRMGRDKAMLMLEGRTLLARAVDTLRRVTLLKSANGQVDVTICGDREELEGADRAIVDRYAECGPLGGMEAALGDLEHSGEADWAFFIPVDMPLLSAALIDELLSEWLSGIDMGLKAVTPVMACFAVVDERPQPLVSLVHRSLHGMVQEALEAGRHKVVPVLQSAGAYCPSLARGVQRADGHDVAVKDAGLAEVSSLSREISAAEDVARFECWLGEISEQFSNVNNEADLMEVATLLRHTGSNRQS